MHFSDGILNENCFIRVQIVLWKGNCMGSCMLRTNV